MYRITGNILVEPGATNILSRNKKPSTRTGNFN